jgi:hypothetical protein
MLSGEGLLVLRVEKGTAAPERIGQAAALARRRLGRSELVLYSRREAEGNGAGEGAGEGEGEGGASL